MQREDAIEKIRKLLALASDNANENEAIAAALKAQKLMADYDVQEFELAEDDAPRVPVEIESAPYCKGRWRSWLANAIADNFRCKTYWHRHSERYRHVEWTQRFVGYELDARAAAMTYEKLVEVGENLARAKCAECRNCYGSAKGVKNTFLLGFVQGVRKELEKQCQALMLVCPKDVEEYYDKLSEGFIQGPKTTVSALYYDATDDGREAGRDAVRSRRMEASQANLLLA